MKARRAVPRPSKPPGSGPRRDVSDSSPDMAIATAAAGAMQQFTRLTANGNGDWHRLSLVRLSEAFTNELDETLADAESGMLSLDQLDRVGARLAMLRAAVVRDGGRPGR